MNKKEKQLDLFLHLEWATNSLGDALRDVNILLDDSKMRKKYENKYAIFSSLGNQLKNELMDEQEKLRKLL